MSVSVSGFVSQCSSRNPMSVRSSIFPKRSIQHPSDITCRALVAHYQMFQVMSAMRMHQRFQLSVSSHTRLSSKKTNTRQRTRCMQSAIALPILLPLLASLSHLLPSSADTTVPTSQPQSLLSLPRRRPRPPLCPAALPLRLPVARCLCSTIPPLSANCTARPPLSLTSPSARPPLCRPAFV